MFKVCRIKRQGNSRRKANLHDIYNLYKFLHRKKIDFPEFVAEHKAYTDGEFKWNWYVLCDYEPGETML